MHALLAASSSLMIAAPEEAMNNKPTCNELEKKVRDLEKKLADRHQTDATLLEEARRYRNIVETIEDGYYEADLAGSFIFINDALCRIFERSFDELMGLNYRAFTAPETGKKIYAMYNKVYRTGVGAKILDYELLRKDGVPVVVEGSASLMKDPSGRPVGFCGIIRDRTAPRKIEEALQTSEESRLHILNEIKEGYWETDMSGTVTFFNEAFAKMSSLNLAGINPRNYMSEEEIKRITGIFTEVYRTGAPALITDYEIKRKDGSVIYIEMSVSLKKNAQGMPVGFCGFSRDRTEQKKAEIALRESEARYRRILEQMQDGYWEIDLGGKFTFFNNAFAGIVNTNHDQLMGLAPRNFMTSAESKRLTNIFIEVYQTGNPIKAVDLEALRVDGVKQHLEMSVSLRRDASGVPVGFCGISRDRTRQVMAEQALRQSEEKYRHILESLEEGYYEMDPAGNFTYCNESVCRMYGYDRDELMTMNYRKYTTPEIARKHTRRFREVFETGIPSIISDSELIRKDGSKLLIESSVYLLKDEAGKAVGFRGLIRDRTRQKQVEKALEQSEEKYRLVVENAHDGIYVLQNGIMVFSNDRMETLTGYAAAELSAMPFTDLIHPKDREDHFKQREQEILAGKDPGSYEFRLLNKDGEILWVELKTVDIVWEGRPAVLHFLGDITPQKRAEAQFMQAQKMEAIGTLAGGIAHDFNNLLMNIQGNASLMLLNTGTDHPHYERLKNIERQVQTGADLTRQLLGAAKGGKYEVKPTDLNQLIESGLDLFERTNKDIAVYKRFQDGVWIVDVDRSQIEQVLLNLYVNAHHAMPGGGELYIETQNVVLDDQYAAPYGLPAGKYVRISVTDTGTGMDEATQKRAFDPFFSTKGMGRGTGLGLASAYGIIKNHNGIINIYSEKGVGTTLRIYLPVSEKKIIPEVEVRDENIGGSETILFVDDQQEIMELGREILTAMGYRVITAMSGKEAVDIYERDQNRIDLVILDMIMPVMGGGETFDHLKKINGAVRVLLSSGYSINGQARTILDRGCRGFIQKPFGMADLSKKVRQILDEG